MFIRKPKGGWWNRINRGEMQKTTYRVHRQGLYPSQERVRLLLTKPGSLEEPGALAIWHETLRELGLETREP